LISAARLSGLKVLEFSHTVMGPTAGLIFAELGADVVKAEPAPGGDHTRRLGGFAAGFFAAFDKRSIAVDLKRPEGQATVHRLAATADIVIENCGPGRCNAWAMATRRWPTSMCAWSIWRSKGIWPDLTTILPHAMRWCSFRWDSPT
jgi:crotonobetainyl-CoA:carnitine CoA-transferase CaiB-like acyl-CoA transferase